MKLTFLELTYFEIDISRLYHFRKRNFKNLCLLLRLWCIRFSAGTKQSGALRPGVWLSNLNSLSVLNTISVQLFSMYYENRHRFISS